MREIKFRGKRIDSSKHERKEFVYGSMLYLNTYEYDCYGNCKSNKKEEVYFIVGEDDFNIVVDKETICQYTGLKDKNGKEIYEGDIVKILGGEYEQGFYEWNERVQIKDLIYDGYNLMMTISQIGNKAVEVIGNIYDNPDLIKE